MPAKVISDMYNAEFLKEICKIKEIGLTPRDKNLMRIEKSNNFEQSLVKVAYGLYLHILQFLLTLSLKMLQRKHRKQFWGRNNTLYYWVQNILRKKLWIYDLKKRFVLNCHLFLLQEEHTTMSDEIKIL